MQRPRDRFRPPGFFRASFELVFGMGFGELCLVIVVAIVVVGPKDLPRFLRKAGQLAGKLRRMANDVRAQSGIDEVLRTEGLTKDIAEIRRLAQGDFVDPIRTSLRATAAATSSGTASAPAQAAPYVVPDRSPRRVRRLA